MPHIVLLGDSIFDNATYVPGGLAVIDHLRQTLPPGWKATLLAVDGAIVDGVLQQLQRLPGDATHLIVSAGGNDALGHGSRILGEPASSFAEVLSHLDRIRADFEGTYRRMVDLVRSFGKPTSVCTIYDAIPGLQAADRAGLTLFNETILREASRASLPVLDLRLACADPSDYSALSPIEPSDSGGAKIARLIRRFALNEADPAALCRLYS